MMSSHGFIDLRLKILRASLSVGFFTFFLTLPCEIQAETQNQHQKSVGGNVASSQTESAPCPRELFNQIHRGDNQGGWLGLTTGISVSEDCRNRVRSSLDSPAELEAILASQEDLNLGLERPAGFLDACLAQYAQRSPRCRGPNCNTIMPVEEQSAAIADYYYSMNRLRMGTVSNYEAIAGIDRILGTPYLKDVRAIKNSEIPGAGDAFNEINNNPNCRKSTPHELDVLAGQTNDAMTTLKEIERRISANRIYVDPNCPKRPRRGGNPCETKPRDEELQYKLNSLKTRCMPVSPGLRPSASKASIKTDFLTRGVEIPRPENKTRGARSS